MIRIEKDVPIPPRKRSGDERYPWDELEKGHNFILPFTKHLATGLYAAAKRRGIKITIREVNVQDLQDEELKGHFADQGVSRVVRVWKVRKK